MAWIQLQHQNRQGENLGGLYLNTAHISAVYRTEREGKKISVIQLMSGDEFEPVQPMMEVLDQITIADNSEQRKAFDMCRGIISIGKSGE